MQEWESEDEVKGGSFETACITSCYSQTAPNTTICSVSGHRNTEDYYSRLCCSVLYKVLYLCSMRKKEQSLNLNFFIPQKGLPENQNSSSCFQHAAADEAQWDLSPI